MGGSIIEGGLAGVPQQPAVDVFMNHRVPIQISRHIPIGLDDEGIADWPPGPEGLIAGELGDAPEQ